MRWSARQPREEPVLQGPPQSARARGEQAVAADAKAKLAGARWRRPHRPAVAGGRGGARGDPAAGPWAPKTCAPFLTDPMAPGPRGASTPPTAPNNVPAPTRRGTPARPPHAAGNRLARAAAVGDSDP